VTRPATSADTRPPWARAFPLILDDSSYRRWRRLHVLSSALPVGLFLALHLLNNAVAIAGPDTFNEVAARLDRFPAIRWIEALAIAAPLLLHVTLGILLGNTAQGAGDASPYARRWMMVAQRATGGWLVVFVAFHVWGIRLASPPESGPSDLFSVTRAQLEHPGLFVLYATGVLSAALHFGLGVHATIALWDPQLALRRRSLGAAWVATVLLAAIGLHAQLAFVSPKARWLERPGYVRIEDPALQAASR
jgi:succinate dehydrogenase / fumarate reductase, cytochrome b subunit